GFDQPPVTTGSHEHPWTPQDQSMYKWSGHFTLSNAILPGNKQLALLRGPQDTLQQTLSTPMSPAYCLVQFSHGAHSDNPSKSDCTATLTVTLPGGDVATYSSATGGSLQTEWLRFKALGGPGILSFATTTPANMQCAVTIDDVSVSCTRP